MQNQKKDAQRSKHRILIVDDYLEIRRALRWLIDGESDLVVCAAAASFDQALRIVEDQSFDLAIVDISLSGTSGLELTKVMGSRCPRMPVVIFSSHADPLYIESALRFGARGYLVKSWDTARDILTAIRQVLDGGIYISRRIAQEFSVNDIERISMTWTGNAP